MADKAHVTSVDALESFRASLIVYLSKARPTLEEISSDVTRTRMWLQNDQRVHWEAQVRRRTKDLEQAQQALFSARIANLREATDAEQKAVHKCKRALEEAEAKLKLLKQWNREFDTRVDPVVKQLGKLQTVLTNDMVQAVAYLAQAVKTLHEYAGMVAPSVSSTPAAPGGETAASDAQTGTPEATPIAPDGSAILPGEKP